MWSFPFYFWIMPKTEATCFFPFLPSPLSSKGTYTLLLLAVNGMTPQLQLQTELRGILCSPLRELFLQVDQAPSLSSETPGCFINIQSPEPLPNLVSYNLGASENVLRLPGRFLNKLNCENLRLSVPCGSFLLDEPLPQPGRRRQSENKRSVPGQRGCGPGCFQRPLAEAWGRRRT